MTTPTRFERIRELFEQAVERPSEYWAPFLAQSCGDDADLQREVLSLLRAHDPTDRLLEAPTPDVLSGLMDDPALSMVGRRVGQYEVTRVIGFGGMGAVYEAHRADDHFSKRVAIKLIKRGMDSDLAIRRFRHERQILATLDHRNIAGLLDGGVTDDGRPYFVMEYVAGVPITGYCNGRHLSVRERLQLFRQVCAAVQYAHQNLVVHRDLKPGNILVAEDGTVKLLDFGIAKILGDEIGPDAAPLTRGGLRALTPEYASPEMFRGDPISVAADVYSLGVVLFELLAGRRPFQFHDLTLGEIEHAVLEMPAPKPSAMVTDDHPIDAGLRNRPALARALAGEIDNIVLMALRKEPARRYPSAEALGQDIKRWLEGQPITAEPDWLGYRASKFVARNTLAVTIGTALLGSLIGGIFFTTRQATRADRERLKAEKVTDFLASMLAAPEPTVQRRDVTVAELLDSATARASRELVAEPEVQALVQSTIGHTYLGLGRYVEAEAAFRSALRAHQISGASIDERLVAANNLASALMSQGKLLEADTVFRQALADHDRAGLPDDTTRAILLDNLGSLALNRGVVDSAVILHRQALDLRRVLYTGDNDAVARALNNVAVALTTKGDYAPAESLQREAVDIMLRLHGENHPYTAATLGALAGSLDYQGKPGADSLYLRVLAIREKLLGNDHPDYAWTEFNYCTWLIDRRRFEAAVARCDHVLSLRGKTLPDQNPIVAGALNGRGRALIEIGRYQEAETNIRESIALRRANLPPGHWAVASSELALGELQFKTKNYPVAEATFLRAYQRLLETVGPQHPRTRDARLALATLYQTTGRPTLAARYLTASTN